MVGLDHEDLDGDGFGGGEVGGIDGHTVARGNRASLQCMDQGPRLGREGLTGQGDPARRGEQRPLHVHHLACLDSGVGHGGRPQQQRSRLWHVSRTYQ